MTEERIKQFFQKKSSSAEAKQVAAFLKNNSAMLDKYLNEEEWKNVGTGNEVPEKFWDEIWKEIHKKSKLNSAFLCIKRIAIAACLVALIAISFYKIINNVDYNKSEIVSSKSNIFLTAKHKTVTNNSTKTMHFILQDSSVVDLFPGSYLNYTVPFQNNKRDIYLNGKAYFKVTKNKDEPFTVYADSLATTALGTEFEISTEKNITIKLLKGKVVIKSTNNNLRGWKNNIYLSAGEQLNYNADKMQVTVEKLNDSSSKNQTIKTTILNKKNATLINNQLSFNNSPLNDVMSSLSQFYNVKIECDDKEIKTMNFTGSVTKTDSLSVILKAISQMNNLDVIKNNNEFIITKHQQ